MLRVSCCHETGEVTEGKIIPEVKQAYNVLACVYGQPLCVCVVCVCVCVRDHILKKPLLRKSFGWRGDISGKTLNLLSLRTDIPDQTRAVHNETQKKLSVSVIV
jgi:hypothetical protein